MNDPVTQRSADGRSVYEFAAVSDKDALKFIVTTALTRMDGEGLNRHGYPYVMENDEAYDRANGLIRDARELLGWQAGEPPLDLPKYKEEDEDDEDETMNKNKDTVSFTASFKPEAEHNGQITDADAQGPQEWDCTEFARQHPRYIRWLAERGDLAAGVTDNDDLFLEDPAAPAWIREWQGPFTITITARESAAGLTGLADYLDEGADAYDAGSAVDLPGRARLVAAQLREHPRRTDREANSADTPGPAANGGYLEREHD